MRDVVVILETMGPEQLFLALVFLAGYALALGEFATTRGRLWALAAALLASGAFAALSNPWEAGVVLIAFAAVGLALFSAAVWALSAATERAVAPAVDQAAAANLSRTAATFSSRPVNTAPILNSSTAE